MADLVPGELVWVAPEIAVGREQAGRRPALVVAGADHLEILDTLAIVVPATSIDPHDAAGEGWLPAAGGRVELHPALVGLHPDAGVKKGAYVVTPVSGPGSHLLAGLSGEQWEHPSLCEGWRVRDVAAHLTLQQMGPVEALRSALRHPGGLNHVIRESARERARRPVVPSAYRCSGLG